MKHADVRCNSCTPSRASSCFTASISRRGQGEILLQSWPRHFGGFQWFFHLSRDEPARLCSVDATGRPPLCEPLRMAAVGAVCFSISVVIGSSAPRASQEKGAAHCQPRSDESDLPPKPKWMRLATYCRYEAKFDHYEDILDWQCIQAANRLLKVFGEQL
jgi:hypothetical protein